MRSGARGHTASTDFQVKTRARDPEEKTSNRDPAQASAPARAGERSHRSFLAVLPTEQLRPLNITWRLSKTSDRLSSGGHVRGQSRPLEKGSDAMRDQTFVLICSAQYIVLALLSEYFVIYRWLRAHEEAEKAEKAKNKDLWSKPRSP